MEIFGEDSIEIKAFHKAAKEMAAGAYELMHVMLGLAHEDQLTYSWTLPDHHTVVTKVMCEVSKKIRVKEIPTESGKEGSFMHVWKEHRWDEFYRAIPANVTHSLDSYVVREMIRRGNHNKAELLHALEFAQGCRVTDRTEIVSIVEVDKIMRGQVKHLTDNKLGLLNEVIESVIDNPVFPVTTIHDAFKTYPQFGNELRQNYINIFAELAHSNVLQGILREITGRHTATYHKRTDGTELAELIRNSNYAIC